ncbi:hypothetical protein BDN71DRAFT_1411815 [Pleurotus eryngii]|uniref:Uncharacterized protein n=1 Tax=Pleurotus eryngii TaxID=5323 RepID=A0A9P6A3Z8_PLEER|nr:hypothetical protein BDN71DRAFT_1411815 [Pleurotus eryngii]
MIPLIPTLVLAFVSFACSAFVILRIVIPILPPHPLSKRVAPAEFGLPNFRSLSAADKSHIWLASFDILAIGIFVWQAVNEHIGGPTSMGVAEDPLSAVRLWFALTVRQTCLLVVAGLTLLHVRMGRSVSFGSKHWILWSPTVLLILTSTALAGVLAGAGMDTLFLGLLAYSSSLAVLSTISFACLTVTLVMIKRNLLAIQDVHDPWPPAREGEEKPRPSFATEEVDALRDGASWITSNASTSSRHNSISAWSFSTHHTAATSSQHGHARHPGTASHTSIPPKSSYWFGSSTVALNVPPVPPLPSPYGPLSPTAEALGDPDPFRRIPTPLPEHPRQRFGSQTSWLTSVDGSQPTLSAWSFPASSVHEGTIRMNASNASIADLHAELLPSTAVSRPNTPALSNAQVLGGYGYAPGTYEAEKGLAALATSSSTSLDVSMYKAAGWLLMIWVPLALSFPYLGLLTGRTEPSAVVNILLVLSVTLSSPLLALNIVLRSPIPIPHGLFDSHSDLPANVVRGPSPAGTSTTYMNKFSHEYKRSTSASVTVVEGRRSGDVWLSKGDAIDGKNRVGRALEMLAPRPKLSVLPLEEKEDDDPTPPLPIQMDDSSHHDFSRNSTPQSQMTAEMGRLRKEASNLSDKLEVAFTSRIMVAERHYSAMAKTVVVDASPDKQGSAPQEAGMTTAVKRASMRHSAHLRSRSVSSIQPADDDSYPGTPTGSVFGTSPSPPPSFPLPPTPPNVRAARLAKLKHKKSFSSGEKFSSSPEGFYFGAVDDINQIDALTAGVLPVLVPGLKVGSGMKIKKGDYSPPTTWSRAARGPSGPGALKARKANVKPEEFGALPGQAHSTPARRKPKVADASARKKHHFSLPSLGLGKDGVHSLASEIKNALETHVNQYVSTPSNVDISTRRITVYGGESLEHLEVRQRSESGAKRDALSRALSTRSLGLRADVPHSVDNSLRLSNASIGLPPSAASTATLFELEAEIGMALESPPQAESTPHNTIAPRTTARSRPPPLPLTHSNMYNVDTNERRSSRRSSIVYIKSDENQDEHNTPPQTYANNDLEAITDSTGSTRSAFAQWSSRAVRPLIPKASKLHRKMTSIVSENNGAGSSSTKGQTSSPRGLRPLSLLQDRDTNAQVNSTVADGYATQGSTRPLTLGGKKQKSRMALTVVDENGENVPPTTRDAGKKLKPLKLARSETAKMRGVLRKHEVLPDVVVRPPSNADQLIGYAYSS